MLLACFLNECAVLDLRECIQKRPVLAFLCPLHTAIYCTSHLSNIDFV